MPFWDISPTKRTCVCFRAWGSVAWEGVHNAESSCVVSRLGCSGVRWSTEGARGLPNIGMFQKGVLGPGCANVIGIVGLGRGRGWRIARVTTLEMFSKKHIPLSGEKKGHALSNGFTKSLRFWERSKNKSVIEV